MTDTTKHIPHSECIQGRCMNVTTGCWGECSIRAAFPLNNVACGDAVTTPRVTGQADEQIAWSHELQKRLMVADDQGDDDLHNLLGEVACCLAALTGRPELGKPVSTSAITQQAAPEALKLICQFCNGTDGHSEHVKTGDLESKDGLEIWFCCHRCRDAGEPCETFHRIQKDGASPVAAPEAPTCPLGCAGPEQGGSGCMAVTGECAMDCITATTASASGTLQWTADEIVGACVKAGLGVLEANSLIVTLKGADRAPAPSREAAPLEATAQNAELVLRRLEQLHQDSIPGGWRELIEEAMPCALAVWRAALAQQSAERAAVEDAKPHGHREDFYLLANCRTMLARKYADKPNWVVAMGLFATGSNSAHEICAKAGIDPDGTKVSRAAHPGDAPAGGKGNA